MNDRGYLLDKWPEGFDEKFTPHIGILINLNILNYEMGRMAQQIQYGLSALVNVEDEILAKAYFAFARSEFSDAWTMMRTLAERMGWDIGECEEEGEERYLERMGELERKET